MIRSSSGEVIDAYEQPVGLRTVEVKGDALLLNGAPVQMKGFGRHEDAPLIGRGECGAVLVRDHEIMRWCGSNSYRTAHYPYSEVDLDLADRRGVLVVSAGEGCFSGHPGHDSENGGVVWPWRGGRDHG